MKTKIGVKNENESLVPFQDFVSVPQQILSKPPKEFKCYFSTSKMCNWVQLKSEVQQHTTRYLSAKPATDSLGRIYFLISGQFVTTPVKAADQCW